MYISLRSAHQQKNMVLNQSKVVSNLSLDIGLFSFLISKEKSPRPLFLRFLSLLLLPLPLLSLLPSLPPPLDISFDLPSLRSRTGSTRRLRYRSWTVNAAQIVGKGKTAHQSHPTTIFDYLLRQQWKI